MRLLGFNPLHCGADNLLVAPGTVERRRHQASSVTYGHGCAAERADQGRDHSRQPTSPSPHRYVAQPRTDRAVHGAAADRRATCFHQTALVTLCRLASIAVALAALVGCADTASQAGKKDSSGVQLATDVTAWAHAVDSLTAAARPYEFGFPSRSTEGGGGRLYRLADSSTRIDIDYLAETGRSRQRFYAHGLDLRLAVRAEERYDRPMSGTVVRAAVDSTRFAGDSAVRWVDSSRVVHWSADSLLRTHGKQVRSEFSWALRMAGTMPTTPGASPRPYEER